MENHLPHRSTVQRRTGTMLSLSALLLAALFATLGCGLPQAGAPATRSTATATATPTASPAAAIPATPTTGPATRPAAPPTGQPTAAPSAATPPAKPATADVDAAVQTVLDYFGAVNQRDYARAYGYWANSGAASGQTSETFARGYADTVRVSVLLGTPDGQGTGTSRQIAVPVTLLSVVNLPDQTQKAQHYQGTYTLRPAGTAGPGGWEIATAAVAEATGPLPPAGVADPTALLRSYFEAIDRREFARAYSYWDNLGQASQQSFAQFEQGFATTKQVKADVGTPQQNAGAGNVYADLSVNIVAPQADGSTKSYTGIYTAHRANVPPFDKLGWRIQGAKVTGSGSVETRPAPGATATP